MATGMSDRQTGRQAMSQRRGDRHVRQVGKSGGEAVSLGQPRTFACHSGTADGEAGKPHGAQCRKEAAKPSVHQWRSELRSASVVGSWPPWHKTGRQKGKKGMGMCAIKRSLHPEDDKSSGQQVSKAAGTLGTVSQVDSSSAWQALYVLAGTARIGRREATQQHEILYQKKTDRHVVCDSAFGKAGGFSAVGEFV
eukprot:1158169-Pelagomonas_calceolata.AAC.7